MPTAAGYRVYNEVHLRRLHFIERAKALGFSSDFLGLTHYAGKDRSGRYLVKCKTARKRLHRSLQKIKAWCRIHRHKPLAWQWEVLSMKLRGHYAVLVYEVISEVWDNIATRCGNTGGSV